MFVVNYVGWPYVEIMSNKTQISIINLFVFNSNFGPREGDEHKKILYYYPPETDIDSKIKNVGLCEAIAKFTETFTDKDCQSLHTQKTRQICFQPEPDYWMVMTLAIPYTQKVKESQTYLEYHEDDVQDSVYESVLQEAYKMFRLFMGTFTHIVSRCQVQGLKQRLEHFYNRYILTMRIAHSDILDVFNGICFLPLDKNTYLRIQCFINQLEAFFPQIRYSAFLYNDQLVWSGLEQEDMRVMYRYLTTSLFPSTLEQEMQGTPPGGATQSATSNVHYGRYITGPPNINNEKNPGKVPRVFINTEYLIEECHLIVYKALSATVCILLDGEYPLTFDFYRSLDSYLGPSLSSLASDISEQYPRRTSLSGDSQYKYVYFNHMNLAQKTTIHADSKKSASVNIPPDILRLIGDLNRDLHSSSVENGEKIVKTSGDHWVVGMRSDQREFYCVINQKSANLIEINEEVKKLCSSHFSNIFFLD